MLVGIRRRRAQTQPSRAAATRHFAVPIVDAAIAALALGGVIYFATSDHENKELGMIVEGSLAAGFGISALLGRAWVRRCRSYPHV
ncbi:MAG TPA: hypothetical protein VIV11_40040 [Kofleriaceae bacterium]